MTDNENLIYTLGNIGVSIKDVQTVLGESRNDLGALCTSENINMWARYKPQCTPAPIPVAPMSYYYRSIINNLNWDKWGHRFGIKIPFCDNRCVLNEIVHDIVYDADESNSWIYKLPYGFKTLNDKLYYRLTDFVRNPNELTLAASRDEGDPTPVELKGYNHAAPIPFTVTTNIPSSMKRVNDADGVPYYELNVLEIPTLTFTFLNSPGNDLHLLDFLDIDWVNSANTTKKWRPILQLFEGWGLQDWWTKDNADLVKTGNAITNNTSDTFTISLPLNDSYFSERAQHFMNDTSIDDMYHICLGIACCNEGASEFGESTFNRPPIFVLPYSKLQFDDVDLPFYYRFCITNHFVGDVVLEKLEWVNTGYARLDEATINLGSVTLPGGILETQPYITFLISNQPLNDLHFIIGNMEPAEGYIGVKLRLKNKNDATLCYYLRPASITTIGSTQISDNDNVYIESSAISGSKTEVRARIIGNDVYGNGELGIQTQDLKGKQFLVEVNIGGYWSNVNASLNVLTSS